MTLFSPSISVLYEFEALAGITLAVIVLSRAYRKIVEPIANTVKTH